MSYRICADCDYVINNRFWHKDECPICESTEMVDPLEDDRDWDKLYEEQSASMFGYVLRYICNAVCYKDLRV